MKTINENYFKNEKTKEPESLELFIGNDEQILWQGKPKKKAYVLGAFFKMFPFALVWLCFDGVFIGAFIGTGAINSAPPSAILILIAFFAFHLIPVWIWLAGIIKASVQHKNLEYAFTNKRIVIKSGIIGIDFKTVYYSQIQSVNLKVGLVDKMLKVGDVYIKSDDSSVVLFDIADPYFITEKLQSIVIDIKTDVEFPNALRPETNPGYNVKLDK